MRGAYRESKHTKRCFGPCVLCRKLGVNLSTFDDPHGWARARRVPIVVDEPSTADEYDQIITVSVSRSAELRFGEWHLFDPAGGGWKQRKYAGIPANTPHNARGRARYTMVR